jgi:hypothetical protein
MGLSFTNAAGPRQHIHSRIRVPWDSRPYFTVSDSRLPFLSPPTTGRATVVVFDPASKRESPPTWSPGPRIYIPRKRVAQLYPPALGSLSVAFYDSQGYGRDNSNPPPHPGGPVCYVSKHKFEADRIQNIA